MSDANLAAFDSKLNFRTFILIAGFALSFLLIKYALHGLHFPHFIFAASLIGALVLSRYTREYLIIALPIVLYATLYDFLRYIPFEWLQPIHVHEPYAVDMFLMNIFGATQTPAHLVHNYFSSSFFDIFCALIYLAHLPMVLIMVVLLWRMESKYLAQSFTLAFFVLNIFAFATYTLYPAAPPWYVQKYGFLQPLQNIPGDAAGLVAFDQFFGVRIFTDNYKLGAVTFGAIPSMHAGFAALICFYSFEMKNAFLRIGMVAYTMAMCFSALYTQHHYLIDVLLGVAYAGLIWLLFEKFFSVKVKKLNELAWRFHGQ